MIFLGLRAGFFNEDEERLAVKSRFVYARLAPKYAVNYICVCRKKRERQRCLFGNHSLHK